MLKSGELMTIADATQNKVDINRYDTFANELIFISSTVGGTEVNSIFEFTSV